MAADGGGSWPRASTMALMILILAEGGIGFCLNGQYSTEPGRAHASVEAIRASGPGSLIQNFHYWASAWLIVHSALHVLVLLFSGAYIRISKLAWMGSLMLAGSILAMQITGNLLPMDRHDAATALVEASIAQRVPLAGETVSGIMLGGENLGAPTLERWHGMHMWLLVPLFLGLGAALFTGGLSGRLKGPARFLWVLPIVICVALALMLRAPYGPAADLASVEPSASPSWYVLPMHGGLTYFNGLNPGLGWIGSALLPGLFALFLVLAPWIGKRQDILTRMIGAVFLVVFGFMALPAAGTAAPISGLQEDPEVAASAGALGGPVDGAKAAEGREVALKHCASCHGKNLQGALGTPSLLDAHRRRGVDAAWYVQFLKDPRSVNSGTTMPSFRSLGDEELAKIAEFLRSPDHGSP